MKKGLLGLLFLSILVGGLPSCKKDKKEKTMKKSTRKKGEKKATTKKMEPKKATAKKATPKKMNNNTRRYSEADTKKPKEELIA